jgi:arylformamidase
VTLIDISVPVRVPMPVYDGNPGVELERVLAIADGETANVTRLGLGVHTGTHIDAPLHFIDGAAGTESFPLDRVVGRAYVAAAAALDAAGLAACGIPDGVERLLLKTSNGRLWESDSFSRDFVRLDGSGATFVVERGVRLVGIDYLSIGDEDAHRVLLGAGVVPLEGLDLREVEPGWYDLLCLPLSLPGIDGAPARAVLRTLD